MGVGATPVAALEALEREAQELAQREGPAAGAATPATPDWRPKRTEVTQCVPGGHAV